MNDARKYANVRLFVLVLVLMVSMFAAALRFAAPHWFVGQPIENSFDVRMVAHAGGQVGGLTYTNSMDALERNHSQGFKFFELDFVFTSDQQLVCLHDWKENFESRFGFVTPAPLSLAEFQTLSQGQRFKNCTLESLGSWMETYQDAVIITDIKVDNLRGLEQVLRQLPDAKVRVIPQVYDPMNFNRVRRMGFERAIWTLYRYKGEDVIEQARKFLPGFAITMPLFRAESGLALKLKAINVPTYVHTINDAGVRQQILNEYGVSEVYTDFLVPQ